VGILIDDQNSLNSLKVVQTFDCVLKKLCMGEDCASIKEFFLIFG